MKDWNKIGDWIRQQREAREWTQPDLVERLKAVKFTAFQPDVSFWETGEHVPKTKTCVALAKVFGVDVRLVLKLASDTNLARQIAEVQGV